ncbi:MAG: hypothetical protein IKJ43_01500 [Bacilli bacterium]|nr:hypothetical protein [Bacilli bacterium]
MSHPLAYNTPCEKNGSHRAPDPIDLSEIDSAVEQAKSVVESLKAAASISANGLIKGSTFTDTIDMAKSVTDAIDNSINSIITEIGNMKSSIETEVDAIYSKEQAAAEALNSEDRRAAQIRRQEEQARIAAMQAEATMQHYS